MTDLGLPVPVTMLGLEHLGRRVRLPGMMQQDPNGNYVGICGSSTDLTGLTWLSGTLNGYGPGDSERFLPTPRPTSAPDRMKLVVDSWVVDVWIHTILSVERT